MRTLPEVRVIVQSVLDVVLHPVRWRIVQALAGGAQTVAEMASQLDGVPQATLYRQIRVLQDAELIAVADEKPVRGVVERTYVLAGVLDGTSARRREQSVLLTAMLQADIDQYLARAASAELDDSFTATRSQLYATEDELRELRDVMTDVLRPLIKPHAGAKPVALGLVIAPLDDRAA